MWNTVDAELVVKTKEKFYMLAAMIKALICLHTNITNVFCQADQSVHSTLALIVILCSFPLSLLQQHDHSLHFDLRAAFNGNHGDYCNHIWKCASLNMLYLCILCSLSPSELGTAKCLHWLPPLFMLTFIDSWHWGGPLGKEGPLNESWYVFIPA